jgi:hypothetical protein
MQISVGYELKYELPQVTPMILTLHVHHSRASDLVRPDHMKTTPAVLTPAYRDGFGNWCTRLVAPQGDFCVTGEGLIHDTGALGLSRVDRRGDILRGPRAMPPKQRRVTRT